jgi:hypothetical protein
VARTKPDKRKQAMLKRIAGACLIWLMVAAASAIASPYLVSDAAPEAKGGQYELWETAKSVSHIYRQGPVQADGSIRVDMRDVILGLHEYSVRYIVGGGRPAFSPVRISVMETCVTTGKNKKTCRKIYQIIP